MLHRAPLRQKRALIILLCQTLRVGLYFKYCIIKIIYYCL